MTDKVRENRLRRMADRQGYRLVKSRRRDPRARDYGTYGLVDTHTMGENLPDATIPAIRRDMDLDEVEAWLTPVPHTTNGEWCRCPACDESVAPTTSNR